MNDEKKLKNKKKYIINKKYGLKIFYFIIFSFSKTTTTTTIATTKEKEKKR